MVNTIRHRLRPATVDDVEAVARIWHDGWREAHLGHLPVEIERYRDLAEFRARAADRVGATTVAVVDGDVAGLVMVHDDEVEQLYVSSAARGSGVAGDLLRRAEDIIAERFPEAWLAVNAANPRARRFYERSGWRDAGAFDYEAAAGSATMTVRAHRYVKRVDTARESPAV